MNRKNSQAPYQKTPYASYTCIREERQRSASRFALFSFVAAFLSDFLAPLALERQKGEAKAGPRKGEGTWPSHEWSACSAGRDALERPCPSATVFLCQLVGEGRKAVGGGPRAGGTCFQPLGSRSSQFPGEAWSFLRNAFGFGHLQCSAVVLAFHLNWETASCSVPRQTLDLRRGSGCPENSLLVDSGKGRSRTKVRTTEVKATGYLSCPPLAALENCTRRKTAPPFRSELTVFLHRPLLEKNNIKLASKELCTESIPAGYHTGSHPKLRCHPAQYHRAERKGCVWAERPYIGSGMTSVFRVWLLQHTGLRQHPAPAAWAAPVTAGAHSLQSFSSAASSVNRNQRQLAAFSTTLFR
ncbi:uncharacterized protein LOC117097754 [Trachypithecus francoisi]|uniref:uncharacterized protein LOC117097754 n=1 Tax=Trachypithecus francoisi TaxID=54180 RepID=UPI00141AEF73|nr:uncharacterized protein LOC117097754 [Trachypithecus francoisi]